LAAEIRQRFPDAQVELVPSKGGRFEVSLDGAPIYEKSKTGRHAQAGEIVGLLSAGAGQGPPG
jgi:selT/selW/selH-like putative selenoprotein